MQDSTFEKFITKLEGKIKVVVFLIRQKKKKKKLLKRGGHALGRTYYYNILQASSNVLHACEEIIFNFILVVLFCSETKLCVFYFIYIIFILRI